MEWQMTHRNTPRSTVVVNYTPALEGGARGTPPSTLPRITALVARGTLAQPGRFSQLFNHGSTSLAEHIRMMAQAQMAAQSQLMATVAVGNVLICHYIYAGLASQAAPM
jgi:hypothetical protein